MLNVVCVLKTGGEYRPEHVYALAASVARNLHIPYRFICLTDYLGTFADVEKIQLPQDWPGWWSKLCLFAPGLFDGPVFYLDLDTIVVGRLDDIVVAHHFTVLENFWSKARIGSGLMAWSEAAKPQLARIYERFCRAPERYMKEYVVTEKWGDQGFIRYHSPIEPARWQTKYPGQVVSFKMHVLKQRRVPPRASVVCFHGKPRPWTLTSEQRRWFSEVYADVGVVQ